MKQPQTLVRFEMNPGRDPLYLPSQGSSQAQWNTQGFESFVREIVCNYVRLYLHGFVCTSVTLCE